MRRHLLSLLASGVAVLALASASIALIGGHDETSENFNPGGWSTVNMTPGVPFDSAAGEHLLISEVAPRGAGTGTLSDSSEYIEIYNPSATDSVYLTPYYISDDPGYYRVVNGPYAVSTSTDYNLRFPGSRPLGPGEVAVVCVTKAGFAASGATVPGGTLFFEMANSNGDPTDDMISFGTNSAFSLGGGLLTNPSNTNGEYVMLYYWDGTTDLVCDVDYASWGANSGTNPKIDKSGVSIDGPDGDVTASAYNNETGAAFQTNLGNGTTLTKPNTYQRLNGEFSESTSGGNGCSVGCDSLTISPDSLPPATLKQQYFAFLSSNGNPPFNFFVKAGSLPPGIVLFSYGGFDGYPTTTGTYGFRVSMTDAAGCVAEKDYEIVVSCPVITLSPSSLPNAPLNQPYNATLTANGNAPRTFEVKVGSLPPGLTLDPDGTISGTATTLGSFGFTASATDSSGCRGQREYKITVLDCPPITVLPESLAAGAVKAPYSDTLNVEGGSPPYVFSVKNGSLPPGLVISGSGRTLYGCSRDGAIFTVDLVTGAGTATGVFTPTPGATEIEHDFISGAAFAQAVDGAFFGQRFDIVTGAPLGPAVSDGGSYTGLEYVGSNLYGTFITGGNGPSTLSILDPNTGASTIIGATGVGPISGLAYDAAAGIMYGISGGSGAGTLYTIDLSGGAATVVGPTGVRTGSLEFGPDGNLYAGGDQSNGGNVYRINPSNGASTLLGPSGFSSVTGLTLGPGGPGAEAHISGTPTALGSFSFTVNVVDSNGCPGSRDYKITTTCPTITISPDSLAAATLKQHYTQFLTSTGSGPFNFFVKAGSLPPGLTLFSSGVIDGDPTALGSFSFTVSVQTSNGCVGERDYTISVSCPVIVIQPASLPNAPVNEPYSVALTANGNFPRTFELKGGGLPPGLTLFPSGTISGTPTTPGSFSFRVSATDSSGCRGERDYKITAVVCQPMTVLPESLDAGTVKVPYRDTLTANAAPPFTFSVKNGSLPPGLTISGSGRALYGCDNNGTIFTVDLASGVGTATGVIAPTGFGATEIEHDFNSGVAFAQARDGGFFGQRFDIVNGTPVGGAVSTGGSFNGLEYVGSTLYGTFITGPGGPSTFAILDPTTGSVAVIGATGRGPISGLAWDGAAGIMYGISGGSVGTLYTLDLSSGAATDVGPTGIRTGSLEFGPDGNLYAGGDQSNGGNIYRIDPSSGASTLLGPSGFPGVTGLTLGPGGSGAEGYIAGTPTAGGSFSFTVNVVDSNGCRGSRDYKITISCPLITLSPDSLPPGQVKSQYSQLVRATSSDTSKVYAYSVVAGSLPPGLSLTNDGFSNGVINGRPTAQGSFAFTIQAVDSNGCSGRQDYKILVDCPEITLSPALLPPGQYDKPYSQVLTPSPASPPYTVVVSSGSLPPGLVLKDHEAPAGSQSQRTRPRASSAEGRKDVAQPRTPFTGPSLTGVPLPSNPNQNALTPVTPAGPGPRILFAMADADDPTYRAQIALLTGGVVDYYDASVDTPLPALFSTYDCVFTKPNFFYADRVLMGDRLADYVDEGGHTVILGVFSTLDENLFPGYQLMGRIMTPAYSPVTVVPGTSPFARADYAGDGTECIHTGVTAYGGDFHDRLTLQGGGIADGSYLQDGSIAHAFRPDRSVIYSNGHGSPFIYNGTGDWPQLIANAVACKIPPTPIVISGTPTQEGIFTFTLSYTDRNGCSGEQEFTMEVIANPTDALLSMFQAAPVTDGLELRWQFGDPGAYTSVGLERSATANGPWIEVAAELRSEGGATVALDRRVEEGQTYYYRLVATTTSAQRLTFGPLVATAGTPIAEFALSRVSPNPTHGATRIDFAVARSAHVRVSVVDPQGRTMAVLAEGQHRPGRYQATWNGHGERGPVPVGLYFIRYQAEGKNLVRRLVLAR